MFLYNCSAKILSIVAANVIPNLTVIGQRFAEISPPNEVDGSVFLVHPVLHLFDSYVCSVFAQITPNDLFGNDT